MIERTKKFHQEIVLMHSKWTDTELYHPQQAKSKTFGKGSVLMRSIDSSENLEEEIPL
jgi:hypothetical protein